MLCISTFLRQSGLLLRQSSAITALSSCLISISLPSQANDAFEFDDLERDEAELFEADIPVVLTTTRLRQARSEAPGSISIISRQMILNSGAREIPELLRFVPGMSIAKEYGHTYQVSYHGTNFAHSKRMQVLIDGHSVYDAALANVDWELIPIALKDIARIEVARGPNTATHGANAYLGVINIISLKADEGPQAELELSHGSYDINDAYLRYRKSFDHQALSLSLLQQKDDGFDKKPENIIRNDSKTRRVINLNWQYQASHDTHIDSQLALSRTQRSSDIEQGLNMQAPPIRNSDNIFINTDIQHAINAEQSLALKLNLRRNNSQRDFQACAPALTLTPELRSYYIALPQQALAFVANPAGHTPSSQQEVDLITALLTAGAALPQGGLADVCGVLNENYREYIGNFELSHTWLLNSQFRTLWGINFRHDQIESETFFKGQQQRFSYQVFNSSEYKLNPYLTANVGLMYENGEDIKSTLTPRLALNAKLFEHHNLRMVYSSAIRKPALFETQARWSYRANNIQQQGVFDNNSAEFFQLAIGNPNLENEKISSYEIGLHSRWPQQGVELDIRLFDDKLNQLVSERPILDNFSPSNNNWAKQTGAEFEFNYHLSTLTQVRINYAYINARSSSLAETSFTPTNNISLFASHQLSTHWSLNSAYLFNDNLRGNHYKRVDAGLKYQQEAQSYRWHINLQLQHRLDHAGELRSKNLYEHDTNAILSLGINF